LQAKLDEERENLCLLQQTLEQERTTRAHGGGARERARDVNHRIIKDRAGEPLVFNRASQNVVAATMLLRNMPEPSTSEARRARDEIRGLLKTATMQQAESSALRRRGLASSSLQSPPNRRKRPRFIPSPHHERTRWPLSVNVSSTIASPEMLVMASMNAASEEAMTAHLEATTCTRAGAMIA
jgi:hypothetical protein